MASLADEIVEDWHSLAFAKGRGMESSVEEAVQAPGLSFESIGSDAPDNEGLWQESPSPASARGRE